MKKLGLLPFVPLALLVSCSEDSVKEVPATGPESRAPLGEAMNARMGATTGDQIPDIVGELERLTGKRAGNASKGMNLEDVAIDFSDIRWIIGQNTGRTNYTFPVLVKGQGM